MIPGNHYADPEREFCYKDQATDYGQCHAQCPTFDIRDLAPENPREGPYNRAMRRWVQQRLSEQSP